MISKPCKSVIQSCSNYYFHSCKSFSTSCSIQVDPQRHQFESFEDKNNSVDRLSRVLEQSTISLNFSAGFVVHARLIKFYLNGFTSLWNKLLNLYCKSGQLQLANQLFDKMPDRNVVSFNSIILTCVRDGHGFKALYLYSEMIQVDKIKPNHITLAGFIGACDGVIARKLFRVFHAQAIRYGLNSNEYVGCSLIDGYAKEMELKDAIKVFHEIAELDLVSWNIMIDGCVRNNSKDHALRIFCQMIQEKVPFDGFTLTSIIKACTESRDLEFGMLLHGCSIKTGLAYGTPISNALITMYSRCKGMSPALKIFDGIVEPNIISWTAMIAGFMQNGQSEEATRFYRTMLRLEMKENEFTFASILPVYTDLVNLEQGRQIHARIVKSWFCSDISVNNALIDMYSKCGCLEEAKKFFLAMEKHDTVSYTSMITALGQHGMGKEALKLLEEMIREGLKPDDVTFIGCLSACSHGGHVDEGIRIFKLMVNVYNIKPRREHFSCIVDMLGRASRLLEAELFIGEMGIMSEVYVWEALLGACKVHGELGLGSKSAEMVTRLKPNKDGAYVLLSNIYAEKELWEGKEEVRESLDLKDFQLNEDGKNLQQDSVPQERITQKTSFSKRFLHGRDFLREGLSSFVNNSWTQDLQCRNSKRGNNTKYVPLPHSPQIWNTVLVHNA